MMHDSAKRFGRIVGDGQGTDFAHGKGRDASHKRSRRKTMEAGKSKKSIETHSEPVTIHRLLRDIRELGCRVTKIANATWEIAQGEEGGASCILVGDESLQRKLASSHAVSNPRMGRGQEKGKRGRDRTRTIRRANQSNNENKRGSRSIYEIFRSDSITTGCSPGQPSNQSQP